MIGDSNSHLRCIGYSIGTFLLCLAVSSQTAVFVYKSSTEHTHDEIHELRRNIPSPLFKAQVDRLETRVRELEKHHEMVCPMDDELHSLADFARQHQQRAALLAHENESLRAELSNLRELMSRHADEIDTVVPPIGGTLDNILLGGPMDSGE